MNVVVPQTGSVRGTTLAAVVLAAAAGADQFGASLEAAGELVVGLERSAGPLEVVVVDPGGLVTGVVGRVVLVPGPGVLDLLGVGVDRPGVLHGAGRSGRSA